MHWRARSYVKCFPNESYLDVRRTHRLKWWCSHKCFPPRPTLSVILSPCHKYFRHLHLLLWYSLCLATDSLSLEISLHATLQAQFWGWHRLPYTYPILSFLFKNYFNCMCMSLCVCLCVCVSMSGYVYLSVGAHGGQIPCGWSYRHLWAPWHGC